MTFKQLVRGAAGAVALALAAVGAATAPAQSATAATGYEACPDGYFCAWKTAAPGGSGPGTMFKTKKSVADLGAAGHAFDDSIRSYVNRTGGYACLFDNADSTVQGDPGKLFAAGADKAGRGHSDPQRAKATSIRLVPTLRGCHFRDPHPKWTSTDSPKKPKFRNLDSDYRTDLLYRDEAGSLWFLPGNQNGSGDGRPGPGKVRHLGTGWNAYDSFSRHGDFTGDGKEDLLAREKATGTLYVFPGKGDGTLGARRVLEAGKWNAMSLITAFGDLTGDGRTDLIARETATGKLYVYPGTASGDLGRPRLIGSGWKGMDVLVDVDDFTGDKRPDLLAREKATGRMWLYPGTARGTLGSRLMAGNGWNAMAAFIPGAVNGNTGMYEVTAVSKSGFKPGIPYLKPGTWATVYHLDREHVLRWSGGFYGMTDGWWGLTALS